MTSHLLDRKRRHSARCPSCDEVGVFATPDTLDLMAFTPPAETHEVYHCETSTCDVSAYSCDSTGSTSTYCGDCGTSSGGGCDSCC